MAPLDRAPLIVSGRAGRAGWLPDPETDGAHATSADGCLQIRAHVRLDARQDLIAALGGAGDEAGRQASDAQLILRAYERWGTACVERLLGDFAFALWDARDRRLFCARDRFGVKPFYYALAGGTFVFSTALDEVRRHARVSDTLNDDAIADFLLFGANANWATTTFADVQRLPPAHTLTWDGRATRLTRYWSVPTASPLRYRRPAEYVEHFAELLSAAVRDRLPDRGGVWLSGGLDSSALLAFACRPSDATPSRTRPHTLTVVYDSLIEDRTRAQATAAARALGVFPTFLVADTHRAFEDWGRPALRTCEPTDDPFWGMRLQHLRTAASTAPVWLYGEGADELLWPSSLADLAGRIPWFTLGRDVLRSLRLSCRPPVGARRQLRAWRGLTDPVPPMPAWLSPAFIQARDLGERWHAAHAASPRRHPTHPEAAHRLSAAPWPWYFETFDPGATGLAAEGRYPFLDLRLVDFVLSIPPMPWCVDKQLLRQAARGMLPDAVIYQTKRPLGGDPLAASIRRGDTADLGRELADDTQIRNYVDPGALSPPCMHPDGGSWLHARPLCLHYWLAYYWRRDRDTNVAPASYRT